MPTLAFIGDVMLGRGVSAARRAHDANWFWGDVRPLLESADAVIANLESPITGHTERWRRTWKMFHFRANPNMVEVLQAGHVAAVNLANNHALDFETEGLRDTLDNLARAGIGAVGAGVDADAAARPLLLDLGSIKVGVLGATDGMPAYAAQTGRPGTRLLTFEDARDVATALTPSVTALRRAGAAIIVLSVHWGPNMRVTPRRRIKHFARAALAAGIDIIHGHSAHVVHGIETVDAGLVLYDTGDFLTDYWTFPFRRNKWSFVFCVDVDRSGWSRLRLYPVVLESCRVERAAGAVRRAMCDRMRSLSAKLGVRLDPTDDGLSLDRRR